MECILNAVKRKKIPINPAIVISNNPDARGLGVAQRLGIKTLAIPSRGFKGSRWQYDKMLLQALEQNKVTPRNGLVCLAGFMRILGPKFVSRYKNRILNMHPALLPAFPGLGAQRQALDYGARYSGCTVHFVDAGTDTGPVILQSIVPVKQGDTEESLSKRILKKEHEIYPQAVDLFARKKIRVAGGKTVIL